jgi:hypothetical protein
MILAGEILIYLGVAGFFVSLIGGMLTMVVVNMSARMRSSRFSQNLMSYLIVCAEITILTALAGTGALCWSNRF